MQAEDYTFLMPTKVESGVNSSVRTGELIQPLVQNKVLVVTDKGIRAAKLIDGILRSLDKQGIKYDIFDEVEPNPSAETIHQGLDVLRETHSDAVLAVGGGSSIDTAKGIAVMATNEGHILDYEGVGKVQHQPLPIIAVPTTAGTGSEVTASTIITNKKTLFKAAIISPHIFPKLAILDPVLTLSCPRDITAATGMDALTHAIESYTSKTATPVSEALALQAMKLISQSLLKAYFVGTDIHSRNTMLTASMLAGFAFSQARVVNVHAISHSFGGAFKSPHVIANATVLPFVLKFNLPACPEKMKDIAEALGQDVSGLTAMEAGEKALQAVIDMNKALNIPDNIKDLGVKLERMPQLVEDSMRSGNVLVNPRLTTADDIQTIIENAYYGRLTSR